MAMYDVEFKTGEFTDFKGKLHKFTVCALVLETSDLVLAYPDCHEHQFKALFKGSQFMESSHLIVFGVSFCCPQDMPNYKESLGKEIAFNRAKSAKIPAKRWIALNTTSITRDFLEEILKSEVEYVQEHPEKFIKGYKEEKEKYLKKQTKPKVASETNTTVSPEYEKLMNLLTEMLGMNPELFKLVEVRVNPQDDTDAKGSF
jgi:hypothetical protein